jgi:hypothetical protein
MQVLAPIYGLADAADAARAYAAAIEPDDVSALTQCVDWVVEHL